MKTKQLLLTFWIGGTLLVGCQKENVHEVSPVAPSVSEAKIKVRSRENVESVVADLLQSQPFKVASVSPRKKTITEISALTSDVLGDRLVKKDTLLFAVKNADLGGSVIVSANMECEPIIAILDSENISLDDLVLDTADVDNPFMPILLSAMEYNYEQKFDKIGTERTSHECYHRKFKD